MRKLAPLVAALMVAGPAFAQTPPTNAELQARTFSWADAMETRGNAGPAQAKTNIKATPVRQAWIDTFAGWLRESYTPVGSLPQMFRNIEPDRAGGKAHTPLMYGMTMVMQDPTWKGGKVVRSPIPSDRVIYIYANQIPGMDPAWEFNTPSQYYFTMYVEPDGTWVDPRDREKMAAEVEAVKRAVGRPSIVYVNSGTIYVLLTRDGAPLPITRVSIGEAIDVAEAGLKRKQASAEASDAATFAARMRGVAEMRARHAGELARPARVRNMQYLASSYDTGYDVFGDGDRGVLYPVYKFDPAIYAQAQAGRPQWLAIGFPRPRGAHKARDQAIYEAMTQRFNYQYAYDAVFAPEKVRGVPYAPR